MRAGNNDPGITYFVIGVSLGLLAGLLWAPRAGKETREELRRGTDAGIDYLGEEAGKVRAGVGRWMGLLKNLCNGLACRRNGDDTLGKAAK
jgi:hypothetical protein